MGLHRLEFYLMRFYFLGHFFKWRHCARWHCLLAAATPWLSVFFPSICCFFFFLEIHSSSSSSVFCHSFTRRFLRRAWQVSREPPTTKYFSPPQDLTPSPLKIAKRGERHSCMFSCKRSRIPRQNISIAQMFFSPSLRYLQSQISFPDSFAFLPTITQLAISRLPHFSFSSRILRLHPCFTPPLLQK